MGYLSRCYFRSSDLFRILFQFRKSATTLAAHPKSPIQKEEPDAKKCTNDIKIDKKTIAKLERISLVDFDNESGIRRLEEAIRFAQKLQEVPIDSSVKPMYSVLQDEKLELREDEVNEGNCRDKILKNAKVLEDEYFVTPLSNKPKDS